MDNIYNEGHNQQHIIGGVLADPPDGAIQSQSTSYETIPMPEDDAQSSTLPEDDVEGSLIYAQDSFGIPGGAITFIKARSSAFPVPPRTIFQKIRTDPSYRLLAIAIVTVLLTSSMLGVVLVTGGLGAIAHHITPNQSLVKEQVTATVRPTQRHTTTAPQPTPTQGSTQVPAAAAQPSTQPSSNSGSNPPPAASANNLPQFVNLPQAIYRYGDNKITVQTLPGATVQLTANYTDITTNSLDDQENFAALTADTAGVVVFMAQANFTCITGDSYNANFVATAPNNSGVLTQITTTIPADTAGFYGC